jgi:restriction system protein
MSASIPTRDLVRAAKEFALPQIEIVAPRLVVALGLACFNSIRRALDEKPNRTIADAVQSRITFSGTTIWCQAHTSPLGQNNRNRDRVKRDWQEMSAWFREAPVMVHQL